jgi:EmrB/QacA subfamily drug resistance transporter
MVALDLLVVSTALSTIRLDLGAKVEELQWAVTAYGVSFAVLLMTGAVLGDRFGRRRVFVAGLGLFTAASAACALAPGIGWLIAARAVQGVGAALVIPLAVALLSAAVPPERRGRALGLLEGVTGLATIAGPLLGGALAQAVGWEWIFWANVPIGLVAIPLVLSRIEESFGEDTALDFGGITLATGAALGVVWGLVRSNSVGWGSFEIVAALTAGFLLAVAFVVWELRAREPMLPMRLFRSMAFSAGSAASFLLFASLYGSVFFLAQFLQTGLGYTPLEAGLGLIPWTAALLVVAPVAGVLADRFGDRPILVGGLALSAAGMGWLALIAAPDLVYPQIVVPLVVSGIGNSMAIPAVQNAIIGAVAPGEVGKASGANSMVQELGGVFGVAIVVAVFAAAGSYLSAQSFTDGFAPAIGVCAALSLVGALAGIGIPGRPKATEANLTDEGPVPETEGRACAVPCHCRHSTRTRRVELETHQRSQAARERCRGGLGFRGQPELVGRVRRAGPLGPPGSACGPGPVAVEVLAKAIAKVAHIPRRTRRDQISDDRSGLAT